MREGETGRLPSVCYNACYLEHAGCFSNPSLNPKVSHDCAGNPGLDSREGDPGG